MNTQFWGPSWVLLHCITFNYPESPTDSDKMKVKLFFDLLADLLPCKYCRESYKKFIIKLPIDDYLDSRKKLTKWLYKIHNMVNDKLRRQGVLKSKNPTYKEIVELYESQRSICIQNKK